jgi:hypothetical protein
VQYARRIRFYHIPRSDGDRSRPAFVWRGRFRIRLINAISATPWNAQGQKRQTESSAVRSMFSTARPSFYATEIANRSAMKRELKTDPARSSNFRRTGLPGTGIPEWRTPSSRPPLSARRLSRPTATIYTRTCTFQSCSMRTKFRARRSPSSLPRPPKRERPQAGRAGAVLRSLACNRLDCWRDRTRSGFLARRLVPNAVNAGPNVLRQNERPQERLPAPTCGHVQAN